MPITVANVQTEFVILLMQSSLISFFWLLITKLGLVSKYSHVWSVKYKLPGICFFCVSFWMLVMLRGLTDLYFIGNLSICDLLIGAAIGTPITLKLIESRL